MKSNTPDQLCGLGDKNYTLAFLIENKPPLIQYQSLHGITPLCQSEIKAIGNECGNGWRKIFNVYAKFMHQFDTQAKHFKSWQMYRDDLLLQTNSHCALLFSMPKIEKSNAIHIIAGRTYGKHLINNGEFQSPFEWIDQQFAINQKERTIIAPFLDYRQLSNIKIERLVTLCQQL